MEKRALLAFGLILLVWVLTTTPTYQSLFFGDEPAAEAPEFASETSPLPAEEQSRIEAETVVDIPAPMPAEVIEPVISDEETGATLSEERRQVWDRDEQLLTLRPDSASVPARKISVDSELYQGEFDTRGGVITSWQLKDYEGIDAPWVELIPQGLGGGPDVFVSSESGVIDFSQVIFDVSESNVVVNGSRPSRTMEFRYEHQSGLGLIKRYTFSRDDYGVALEVSLTGTDKAALGNKYYVRWGGGINITEPDRDRDLFDFRSFRYVGDQVDEQDIGTDEIQIEPLSGETHWVGVRSKYFFIGLAPEERAGVGSLLSGKPLTDDSGSTYRQMSAEIDMSLSNDVSDRYLLYLGPVDYELLLSYDNHFEEVVYLGWSFLKFFSYYILVGMIWLHQGISNYGVVIIVLSVIVKVVLYPLTYKSMMSMQNMQKVQPKMEELRAKYKNDAQKLQKEMMKLYKEQGVNPVGGCLPMVLQMPILFSLYSIFNSTIEIRREPFVDMWITDLSQADPLYILPALMGVSMLVQSMMTMKDPRQKAFVYMMPVMLIFFMYNMPSGLILYWTMINILTIVQQYFQNRFMPTASTT